MLKAMRVVAGSIKKLQKPIWLNIFNFILKGIPYWIFYLWLLELLKPKGQIDTQRIILLFVGMLVVLIAHLFVAIIARTNAFITGYTLTADARIRLGDHLRRLSMGFFKRRDPGDITALLLQDMDKVEHIFGHLFAEVVACIILPLVLLLFFFYVDWKMASVVLITVLIAACFLLISQKITDYVSRKRIASENNAVSRTLEYLQGIKTLKAFNLTGTEFVRLKKALKKLQSDSVKSEVAISGSVGSYLTILELGFVALLLAGIYFFFNNQIAIPVLVMFLIVGYCFYDPLKIRGPFGAEMRYMNVGAERIAEVINRKPLTEPDEDHELDCFDIEFENVSFKYEDNYVLKNVSFKIPQNTITALVGPSGAGKTTIANLIARFWDVDSGEILIGGHNIKDLKTDRLLLYISMVFQDVYLFNDTVFNNIKIGKKDATKEEVIAAAKAAQCHEFIEKLPNRYNTIIGEGGSTLSGGERQRISIARAILKDAPIVILDEATASLDPENERLIQEAINELVKSKTLIVIAHRLWTIVNADNILVIGNERIVESGKHADLAKKGGLYSRMWNEQMQAKGWKFGTHQER